MTGLERLRELARKMSDNNECALMQEIIGRSADGCVGRSCGECRGLALGKIADQIERETAHDPSKDVSMSAYDLLPEEDREAISLALDCGGAEEIKKRLMPEGMEWPKVDGKPVDFKTAYEPSLGVLEAVSIYNNGACMVMGHDGIIKNVKEIHAVTPKVLDADGVEIRVGDTVCGTRDMEPMKVVDTDSHECGFKRIKCEKEGDGFWFYCPDELTHKLPVLAADGRPLRVGETVYKFDDYRPYTLKRFEGEHVYINAGGGSFDIWTYPDKIIHERPESWERLEEDAGKNPFDYCKDVGHRLDTCENSEAYKARDLVRRARALAERDAS